MFGGLVVVIACLTLHTHTTSGWLCQSDAECVDIEGAVCADGLCACPIGQQRVNGGTRCAIIAPYYSSPCEEDHQCSRLFPGYQCQTSDDEAVCRCQPDHHYVQGRCWPSRQFGEQCTQDQQCMGTLRDPDAMVCSSGICDCADNYYLRQRGECRKSAFAVGDECVLDADCRFDGGLCDRLTLTCYSINANSTSEQPNSISTLAQQETRLPYNRTMSRVHSTPCGAGMGCPEPFVCSDYGVCVCPLGYYMGEDGVCLAELGSSATIETCVGLLAVVRDGVCTCPDNFYYDENMRDCVKAMIRFTDSCISDAMCHSFGAESYCGPPQEPWGIRSCECTQGLAVYDASQNMCRLFSAIGDTCEVDTDCFAGNVPAVCAAGVCACPDGLSAIDGLCLTAGLELGESCQASQECGPENSVCANSVCACANGYQQNEHVCLPTIGGSCSIDTECVTQGTVCDENTCRCGTGTVEYEEACWTIQQDFNGTCTVPAQCAAGLGDGGSCVEGVCACADTHHYRGGQCWPRTGLFESCSRSTECYLGDRSDLVVCRNGLCQCDFEHPYEEELRTCSSASTRFLDLLVLFSATILTFIPRLLQ